MGGSRSSKGAPLDYDTGHVTPVNGEVGRKEDRIEITCTIAQF